MARPLGIEYLWAFYHVISRGNEQKDIFRVNRDRERFLGYLKSATERYGARVHVCCLMSNHYHLLLETPLGNLSRIMLHIGGAYINCFNARHRRSGHLFQRRYKAIVVEMDEYAQEVSGQGKAATQCAGGTSLFPRSCARCYSCRGGGSRV